MDELLDVLVFNTVIMSTTCDGGLLEQAIIWLTDVGVYSLVQYFGKFWNKS